MSIEQFSYLNRFLNESNMPEKAKQSIYELEVPPGVPLILNDINFLRRPTVSQDQITQAIAVLIGTTYKSGYAMYLGSEMIRDQFSQLTVDILNRSASSTTAIVLPGNGAVACIQESFTPDSKIFSYPMYQIQTDRVIQNNKPVDVALDLRNSTLYPDLRAFSQFVVIDDVIASGLTATTLAAQLRTYTAKGTSIRAVSWLTRNPTNIQGYDSVHSLFRYFTTDGWPAVNSISTLLRADAKGAAVREGYIKKYIAYPYGFIKQLNEIKKLTILEEQL